MTVDSVKRAYKYRFYPTEEQAQNLAQTFGCTRKIYNHMLDTKQQAWRLEQRNISYGQTSTILTELKKNPDYAYLNDVSSVPLQQGLRHLNTAYSNFFNKHSGYPKFKSRHDRQSAEYTASAFRYRDGQIFLAKHKQPLNIAWSRPLPAGAKPSTITVSLDKAGRYHLSILVEETITPLPASDATIGLDLGVKTAIVTSNGDQITLPKVPKKLAEKLKRAQRELARREKGSKNRAKTKLKIARINAHIADKRRDALHKATTSIIRENQTVVIEDLAVRAMTASASGTVENPGKNVAQKAGLNRAILNNSFAQFRSMLEYKAAWYGRELVTIGRFTPSTRMCGNCSQLTGPSGRSQLGVRSWTCSKCQVTHDRDVNAAKNILAAGLAVSVCGDGRATRVSA